MKFEVGKNMQPLTYENILSIKSYKGYLMLLADGPMSINGYVVIKPKQEGYKFEGDYTDSEFPDCWGGITFDDKAYDDKIHNLVRVIGFDTAHGLDLDGKTNWTTEKLFGQCKSIINQLKQAK